MSPRNIILILAAVLITVGTGLVARSWINSQRQVATAPDVPQVKATRILVAQRNLPSGTFIKEKHLIWQSWPDNKPHATYFVKGKYDEQDLVGTVVRRGITAGEPITIGRLVKPGERGFLAAVLRPGYRAMAVRINATTSIAGLIFPGDRVDIILTHRVKRGGKTRRASETVLMNVRVLAIDRRVDDQENSPRVGKNATFEVTPKQAEMLAVVQQIGKLSLVLRSLAKDEEELNRLALTGEPLAEPDPERGRTHTWDTEVSRLLFEPRKKKRNRLTVQVQRGSKVLSLEVEKPSHQHNNQMAGSGGIKSNAQTTKSGNGNAENSIKPEINE